MVELPATATGSTRLAETVPVRLGGLDSALSAEDFPQAMSIAQHSKPPFRKGIGIEKDGERSAPL